MITFLAIVGVICIGLALGVTAGILAENFNLPPVVVALAPIAVLAVALIEGTAVVL